LIAANPLEDFDQDMRRQLGASCLIGIDEAGRGPLAGPVVAAAVVLDPRGLPELAGVRDSKELSAKARERLFPRIKACAQGVGVGWALSGEIDEMNILNATLLAMRRAVGRLAPPERAGAWALVDGNQKVPGLGLPQRAVVDGDALSLSIASASIVAKVVRDRWMAVLDRRHPGYGFGRHKGYGTAAHLEALRRLGPCPEHRRSFGPVASQELVRA
jgi:ribonuclease HII